MDTQNLSTFLERTLINSGLPESLAHLINLGVNLFILGLVVWISLTLTRMVVRQIFKRFTSKTKTTFDDFLMKSNFPTYIGNIVPLFILIYLLPIVLIEYPRAYALMETMIDLYIIILVILIFRSVLRTIRAYLGTKERWRDKPMDSFVQVIMIFIWALGFVFIFSVLTDRSVLNFLISLGAASAVFLLIFQGTILGFVASIQVSVNDIVRIGDWIAFNKFGADGFVTEINLATVKVQNWDKTITTIPTQSLISDSFQNWRGMQESGGRRIMRSIFIKQSSVKFTNQEDLKRYETFSIIAPYLKEKQAEIEEFNKNNSFDRSTVLNGRNQTNLGIFRKYAETYLQNNPNLNKDMWLMARHLAPTSKGIPIQIYCFSSDKRWVYYEAIMADIFDHLIAAIPYFDLKLFEEPTGDDIGQIAEQLPKLSQAPEPQKKE